MSTRSRCLRRTNTRRVRFWLRYVEPELIAWARRRGALIVEDDYDAEYRYDREPIASLQGLAPDCVAYVGTASKTLAPAVRLGWVLVPSHLVGEMAAQQGVARAAPCVLTQAIYADAARAR